MSDITGILYLTSRPAARSSFVDPRSNTAWRICVHDMNRSDRTVWREEINRLTPNDLYMSRTAPLTSKRCILYIYSTNICTEYFKHALYSPFFFSLQNAVCFIMLTCLVPVLFAFYIQDVLKLKKNNSGAKGLTVWRQTTHIWVVPHR